MIHFKAMGRSAWRHRIRISALWLSIIGLAATSWFLGNRRLPQAESLVFQGVTYGCERLASDSFGRGLVHWVRVDLAAPGVELFVTPLNSDAVAEGWQYRLRTTKSVVQAEGLAVAVNGCLFTSNSWKIPFSGDLARSVETVVADHQVSHVWEHTYLLWFDDDLGPHLETSKPPSEELLKRACWAVGGQGVGLSHGVVRAGAESGGPDARTAVGIDADRRLLILAVFENASPQRAMEKLAELGAKDGMLLDGGDSSSMVLGAHAQGVRPGVLMQGWRSAVATHLGVRARPLAP